MLHIKSIGMFDSAAWRESDRGKDRERERQRDRDRETETETERPRVKEGLGCVQKEH